jgi:MFS family permease
MNWRQLMRRSGRALREIPGLGRLVAVRFASQFGDGMFQAGLGGAILFNPERAADPRAIAAGFAVLLVPYSVVGPFAGALLDRWDRRLVLLWASVLRGVFILCAALLLGLGVSSWPILALALSAVGVSRFVLAGVSASLPQVVRPNWLVPTNSVLATVGSVVSAAGAAAAVAVIAALGAGDRGSAWAVGLAAIGSGVGALAAAGFSPHQLGPGRVAGRASRTVVAVLEGLRSGLATAWRAPGVTVAMAGICAHRMVFGVDTLIMVLVMRHNSGAVMGFVGFGAAAAATAAGMLVAAVTTPILIPLIGRNRLIAGGLFVALVVQSITIIEFDFSAMLAGALLLGLAGQSIKLSGDAAMQLDVDSAHRGRVFALQDAIFNIAFVAALGGAALVIAPDGRTGWLVYAGAAVYLLGLVAALTLSRRKVPTVERS